MDIYVNLVLLALATILIFVWKWNKLNRNFPPGPLAVPLIGNININWKDQISEFRKFRKQYGDIYTLQLGTKTVVVVNGMETLKELLIQDGDVVSERPDTFVFNDIMHKLGFVSSSGSLWKEHRTFALTTLRDFGFGKRSLEGKIIDEVEHFLNTVKNFDCKPFDVRGLINISISNVICSIAFGRRYDYDDEHFVGLMKGISSSFSNVGVLGLFTFFPFLKYVPGDPLRYADFMDDIGRIERHINNVLEENRRIFDGNECFNYTDAFLKKQNEEAHNEASTFSDEQLLRQVMELFSAGTETTSTAITWFILLMLFHPEVEERMRNEIREVVGESRYPSLSDRHKMCFCEAVLHETLRIGNIIPFGLPHGLTSDLRFHGYTIPKDAMIFPSLDSILSDPDLFENPMEFNPSRFLTADGSLKNTEKVLAFGIGRRICLGESLARMELFLFATTLIQRFHLLPSDVETLPSYKDSIVGVARTPLPFTFRAEEIL